MDKRNRMVPIISAWNKLTLKKGADNRGIQMTKRSIPQYRR